MSSYKKNILVGATVLAALLLLGWMILRFSDAPFRLFTKPQMSIHFVTLTAEGVSEGTPIFYKGVVVGRVMEVLRSEDQTHVVIESLVDTVPPLPGNVEGRIRSQIIGGSSSISLSLIAGKRNGTRPATGPTTAPIWAVGEREEPRPEGALRPNQELVARFVGFDIMPREFTDLAVDLKETSEELRRTSKKLRESEVIGKMSAAVDTLRQDMDKAGVVLDSINKVVSDEGMRKDLREALANFRGASESATRIGSNLEKLSQNANARVDELAAAGKQALATTERRIDEIAKQAGDRLTQVAKILENAESVSRKLNEGGGTAAQLINNPALYENLLDTSKELRGTMQDLRRLVEQWEEEGVYLKLRGK